MLMVKELPGLISLEVLFYALYKVFYFNGDLF